MVLVLVINNAVVVFLLMILFFIVPCERKMKALLPHVFFFFFWANANKNEISFGINKCATMVIKPLNFVSHPDYEESTFHLVCILSLKNLCIFT